MAVFQIEEFGSLGRMAAPVPQYPPVAIQQLAVGGASVPSDALSSRTVYARLVSDTACYFRVATTAAAASASETSSYLPAGVVVDIGVQGGLFISVIAA